MVAIVCKALYIGFMTLTEIAKRLAALGNETRLDLYQLLVRAGDKGLAVTQLQKRLNVPASTLSHHLHKLMAVALVTQERHGTTLICRADFNVMTRTFDFFARQCCVEDQSCCTASDDNNKRERETNE